MKTRTIACIVLYRKHDKTILIQKRALTEKRRPGLLALFGGGLDEGETPVEGVKREAMEELGYVLKNPTVFEESSNYNEPEETQYFETVFLEEYDEAQTIKLDKETEGFLWMKIPEALANEKISEHRKESLRRLEKFMENVW